MVIKRRALPSGAVSWRAVYEDPDTGRDVYTTLELLVCSTAEGRRRWGITKARALAKRRAEIESGAPRSEAKELAEAVADYLGGAGHRLRGRTLTVYRLAIDPFVEWCSRNGVHSTADLSRAKLAVFRDHLIARPRRAAAKGGAGRGAWREVKKRRSPVSINRELRTLKTVLNAWRVAGRLPQLDRDAISDVLKALPAPRPQPEYLAPSKLEKLLRAALRHDAETFKVTRREHAGHSTKGSTPRYIPIAALVSTLLLTGMRRGEALGLRWDAVDLDAVDQEGRKVGEIRLKADDTKTHHARTIGLEVSPALRAILAALKLRAGKGAVHVFETIDDEGKRWPYTADGIEGSRARMKQLGAPGEWDWQLLRSTCATYLTNAPSIFGAAAAYLSARQLGHSIVVAERNYLGVHRGIDREARTLEAAMQIEAPLRDVLAAVSTASPSKAGAK